MPVHVGAGSCQTCREFKNNFIACWAILCFAWQIQARKYGVARVPREARRDTHKSRHKAANDMFEDNSSTNLERPNENNRLNTPLKHDVAEVDEVPVTSGGLTTKFVCRVCVCGNTFDDRDALNQHLAGLHHPKRTVTASDIANGVFEGRMNFPKTKAEIVKYLKDNKDRLAITPEVIDTVKRMLDKLYYTEADLIYGIKQGRR